MSAVISTTAEYSQTPKTELVAKIAKLLELNYKALYNDANMKYKYDEAANRVYDEKIAPSNDFSYSNILTMMTDFVYNQQEVDELLGKGMKEINDVRHLVEEFKRRIGENIAPIQTLKYEREISALNRAEAELLIKSRSWENRIFEKYQPDQFSCKPRDYVKMMESFDKVVNNPRIKAYADWYANASIEEQNTQYEEKYDEYFKSLDDLITLHEITLGIIPIDGVKYSDE